MIRIIGTRAVSYRRVSLKRQAEYGFSLQGQQESINRACAAYEIPIVGDYVDAGISGKDMINRPQLNRLLDDAEKGRFDIVMVWQISRLARDFLDLLTIVDHLRRCGVRLYSLNEQFDSETLQGKLMMQVHGIAAEFQRTAIAENVSLAMNRKSLKGEWNAGNNVFGYRLSNDPLAPKGTVEIVPKEAEWVSRIFTWYAEDEMGYKAIAWRLNNIGIRTVNNKRFSIASVRNILHNRNYLGLIKYRKWPASSQAKKAVFGWSQGSHPPLIEQALWDKAEAALQRKTCRPINRNQRPFPLSGILKCPDCGGGMVPGHTKSPRKDGTYRINFYYVCSTYNNQGPALCKRNPTPADAAEQWFFKRLQNTLLGPLAFDPLKRAVHSKMDQKTAPLRRGLLLVNQDLNDTEAGLRKNMLEFESGELDTISLAEGSRRFKEQRFRLQNEKERLEQELTVAQQQAVSDAQIKEALLRIHSLLQYQAPDRQRELVRLLVDRIVLTSNRNFSHAVIHGSSALFQFHISGKDDL
ncbi:recombinase family protein [Paenibacillus albidus]|uniref:recombinase family protein n=1 Tax=Paenibacillus albidus TaxID=2041023 RepID=UPI001BE833F3|nr:recombinase family protein [Paenibacillus albidus]MBT2289510.1 recombinase family protein [Paenibacillus albidus]